MRVTMLRVRQLSRPLIAFGQKLSNDWVLNLSGMLAFNLLMASIPFLLVLLAVLGITLGLASPTLEAKLIQNIGAIFPGQAGTTLVDTAAVSLKHNAGLLLVLGVLSAIFLGSRLFIVIENCFGIIYRVRSRDLLPQNAVALGMVLLFVILVPAFLLLSITPSAILILIHPSTNLQDIASTFTQAAIFLITLLAAMVLFGLIYLIVPNRSRQWSDIWPGTIVAGILLMVYEKIFPWYTQMFLRPSSEGSIVGFAIVILIFYNYLAFILLLGAEINSWVAGKRPTAGDLQAIITQVEMHQEELAKIVPAAVHQDASESPAGAAQRDGSQDSPGEHSSSRRSGSVPDARPSGWQPIVASLRERRHGRSILAGQIAAAGVAVVSLLAWLIHSRKR
jgi:membrane protein